MACCGQKRALLRQQSASKRDVPSLEPIPTERERPSRESRVFEYLGTGMLTLYGAVSGTAYRFTYPGAVLEVLYEDSFAMMAERSLRWVR